MDKQVLVIDDAKIVCKGIQRLLEDEGYTVNVAFSGEDGVAVAKEKGCQMAIVDLILPGIDGVEVCRQIKGLFPKAKVVIMSGYLSKLKEKKSEFDAIAGCKAVIEKPFESETIIDLAEKFFESGNSS